MAERTATILEKVQAIAERVASSEKLEVVDVQLLGGGAHRVLRVFIDKPEGVSLGDCELVSQQVGTILDVEDVIPGGRYTLEVSSPGVERKLSRPADFERFMGQKIRVILREPLDDRRQWIGKLTSFADGIITLEPVSGPTVQFPLAQVEKANLKYEW